MAGEDVDEVHVARSFAGTGRLSSATAVPCELPPGVMISVGPLTRTEVMVTAVPDVVVGVGDGAGETTTAEGLPEQGELGEAAGVEALTN